MQCCDTHMMLHCFDINMMIHFVIIFVVDEKTINWNTPWILSKLYIFVSLSDHYTNVFQIVYRGKEWYKRVTFVPKFHYAYVFLYIKLTFPPQKRCRTILIPIINFNYDCHNIILILWKYPLSLFTKYLSFDENRKT